MIKRLRRKFVIINMAIVTLMLCVILGMVYYFTSANLERSSISMMQALAISPPDFRPDDQSEDVHLPFFTVRLGAQGEVVSTDGGYYDLSDGETLNELVDLATSSPKQLGVLDEYDLRYYRMETPGAEVIVFADISSERATLSALVRNLAIIGALAFLTFLGASVLLSKWAVRPVEKAWQQQREFVASASHELKTPLTVVMTNAELLSEEQGGQSKNAESIVTMSQRMRRLIDQLLELARAEDEGSAVSFSTLDFARIAESEALAMETVYFERNLLLETEIEDGIFVTGDETELRKLMGILLDNAGKYSGESGTVRVRLKRYGKSKCRLCVANEGVEIPEAELENIFRRFYRAESARGVREGFGLGLSIAASIVNRHRGRIWAESENGENRFYVELPTA